MKTRHFYRIIAAMTAATICILVLQGYIWQQSINEEKQRFDDSVERAVTRLTHELHGVESRAMIVMDALAVSMHDHAETDSSFRFEATFDDSFTSENLKGLRDSLLIFSSQIDDSLRNSVVIRMDSDCPACLKTADAPVLERIRPILEERLALDGIDNSFDYGVVDVSTGSWIVDPQNVREVRTSDRTYQIQADFNAGKSAEQAELRIYFPNEKIHVLKRLATSLALSGLLALGVHACLAYSLKTIMRQKQLSEIKTDFINNMTHELKTPIATISLASEALTDEEVEFPPEKRAEYIGMISTEAGRLSDQVEKVLQMSLIDKGDLGLNFQPINIHHMIEESVGGFKLKIQQRQGALKLALNAQRSTITGDPMHVRQMLSNLLDNAEKYSPGTPSLSIETRSMEEGIEIAVTDRGVGIGRDKLKRIFDRFYRIPSGNLHDVKGFGLGLSYVMSMAEAHGGQVRATSKPGQGSTFTLTLPYADA